MRFSLTVASRPFPQHCWLLCELCAHSSCHVHFISSLHCNIISFSLVIHSNHTAIPLNCYCRGHFLLKHMPMSSGDESGEPIDSIRFQQVASAGIKIWQRWDRQATGEERARRATLRRSASTCRGGRCRFQLFLPAIEPSFMQRRNWTGRRRLRTALQ